MDSMVEREGDGRLPSGAGILPTVEPASSLDGSATSIPDAANRPRAMWEEGDDLGGVKAYMCLTDFECEVGWASGGNTVYPSEDDCRARRRCVSQCGIIEVRIVGVRIVQEAVYPDDPDTDAIAIEARQGRDGEAGSVVDESAGRDGIAQPSSALTDDEGGS